MARYGKQTTAPARPCSSCGRRDTWERGPGGGWACGACMDRPRDECGDLHAELLRLVGGLKS